jgi:hypothetical protein
LYQITTIKRKIIAVLKPDKQTIAAETRIRKTLAAVEMLPESLSAVSISFLFSRYAFKALPPSRFATGSRLKKANAIFAQIKTSRYKFL